MDLLALVEVERLDRCNRGGGGEIGRRWLELAEFHFLPAQLTWLRTLHHKMKNPDCTSSMATLRNSAKSPVEEVQKHIAMEVTTLPDEASKEIPIRPSAKFFTATKQNRQGLL
jgi:hypothetical protein